VDLRKQLSEAWSRNESASGSKTPSELRRRLDLSVDDVVAGTEIATSVGPTYVREWRYPLEYVHGRHPLGRYIELQASFSASKDPFGVLGGYKQPLDFSQVAFFDTETTGLSGGTGTYVILAGIGYFTRRDFTIKQYFLRDYHEEPALLAGVQGELNKRSALISFNGRTFDVPLLQTRFILFDTEPPQMLDFHWDLLHSSRRVYGWQLESCSLSTLERSVLQFERAIDLPGAEIPARYFSYLREQNAAQLEGICEHNRDDLLSLVSLSSTLLELALDPGQFHDTAHDFVGLGRSYELEGQLERAVELYTAGLAGLDGDSRHVCDRVRLRLARVLKRLGRYAEAAEQWEELITSQRPPLEPYVELAKHYEHRLLRCSRALELVDEALPRIPPGRQRENLLHRRRRLQRKLHAQQAE